MKFADISGHTAVINALRDMADSGNIPHALLFSGISGIGKFRTARAFASYLHCKNPMNGDSCGVCPSCLQHKKHNNPDLHYIYPVLKKDGVLISKDLINPWKEMLDNHSLMPFEKWAELIKAGNSQPAIFVDESDDIVQRASLSAFQEDLKIFIIWLPERMRLEAANKLLKIIEEPFEDTLFILVSNEDSKILPTISSRTQRFIFRPLETDDIKKYLISNNVEPSLAESASLLAEGSLQKAEQWALDPDELIEFSNMFKEIMRAAYALKAKKMKELAESAASFGREKLIRFLTYMARMIRDNYITNFQVEGLVRMTEDEKEFSNRFAPFIHDGNVEQLEAEIARAAYDIERNINSKIVTFDLFLLVSRLVRKPRKAVLPFEEWNDLI